MAAAGRTCLLYRQAPRRRIPATDLRSPRFRRHRDPRTEQLRPCRITAQRRLPRPRVVRARADRPMVVRVRVGRAQVARERCAHQKTERRRPRRRHRPMAQLRPRCRHPLTVRRLPHRRQRRPVPERKLGRSPHRIGAGTGAGGGATSERRVLSPAVRGRQRGALVEDFQRFVVRRGGQHERKLPESQLFAGLPVLGIRGGAEL